MFSHFLLLSAFCLLASVQNAKSFTTQRVVSTRAYRGGSHVYMAGFGAKKEVAVEPGTAGRVADASAPCKQRIFSSWSLIFTVTDTDRSSSIVLDALYRWWTVWYRISYALGVVKTFSFLSRGCSRCWVVESVWRRRNCSNPIIHKQQSYHTSIDCFLFVLILFLPSYTFLQVHAVQALSTVNAASHFMQVLSFNWHEMAW